jgi:uncharacterized membrane protein YfcA
MQMRIGSSLLLIAVGAILRFAVRTESSHGINIWTIGIVLMIVGAAGLVVSAFLLTARRRTDVHYHRDGATVVESEPRNHIEAL